MSTRRTTLAVFMVAGLAQGRCFCGWHTTGSTYTDAERRVKAHQVTDPRNHRRF